MDRPKKTSPNFDGSGIIKPKVRLYTCSCCGAKFSTDDDYAPSACPKCDNTRFY